MHCNGLVMKSLMELDLIMPLCSDVPFMNKYFEIEMFTRMFSDELLHSEWTDTTKSYRISSEILLGQDITFVNGSWLCSPYASLSLDL
ncbi:hypothetical protein Lalb_Chr20g0121751 [Lupinus albus]|uniref:Uncharacterized protein n=1 Tax=Lupinus albus TaxID=3870 RepID=A0A6A4NVE8_LUPAL|nr:hypothetical protein Lalb_Chr20g0121751 [Lupinus albus]